MYVIGKIVYGWDFTKESGLDYSYLGQNCNNLAQLLEEKKIIDEDQVDEFDDYLEELFENEDGYIRDYSGNGETPQGFGLEIEEFDECNNFLLSKLNIKVNTEDKNKLKEYVKKLPKQQKKIISALGKPKLFVMWATS